MSCPKCGSGAVFQGKCRECGTVVDVRRASSSSVSHSPIALGDDDDGEGDTILDKRKAKIDPDGTRAPPRASKPATPAAGARSDSEPDADEEKVPFGTPGKPHKNPQRESWYAAAGMRTPSERYELPDVDISTSHNAMPGYGAPALLLAVSACAQGAAVALGQNPLAGLGAAVAFVAALLLWRGAGPARAAAWLFVLWSVAFAALLAVLYKQPLVGGLQVLPAVCLLAALHAGPAFVRWLTAFVGVALSLAALGPQLTARREAKPTDELVAESGSYFDARLGYSMKVPDGVFLYASPKAAKEYLPSSWTSSMSPKLVFATADRSLVGALLVTTQPPGMDLSNVIASTNLAGEPPVRNDKIAPDSLREFEAEGWEFPSAQGMVRVVLCRAADGRTFGLFGVSTPAARVRNEQLFSALAWGLQVRRTP